MILDLVMCKTPNLRQMHSMIYIFKKMACNYGTPYAGVQACDKTTNQICLFNLTFKDCLYLYFLFKWKPPIFQLIITTMYFVHIL